MKNVTHDLDYGYCRIIMADRIHEATGWSAKLMRKRDVQETLSMCARTLMKGGCVKIHNKGKTISFHNLC